VVVEEPPVDLVRAAVLPGLPPVAPVTAALAADRFRSRLNHSFGTCADAAHMNAFLGIVNGYQVTVDELWIKIRVTDWSMLTYLEDHGHAVTTLLDGASSSTLTSGKVYPDVNAIVDALRWAPQDWYHYTGEGYTGWRHAGDDTLTTPNFD
jgi:hypothetical protein